MEGERFSFFGKSDRFYINLSNLSESAPGDAFEEISELSRIRNKQTLDYTKQK